MKTPRAGRFGIVRLEERVAPTTGGVFLEAGLLDGSAHSSASADAGDHPADNPRDNSVGENNTLSVRGGSAADVRLSTGD